MRTQQHWMCLGIVAVLLVAPALSADPATDAQSSHDAALAELEQLGADIQVRSGEDGERIMITTDGRWQGGDDGFAALRDVRGLWKLRIGGKITDAALAHLGELDELTSLDVHVLGITDEGVRHLRGLTELERLNLTYSKVTDAGLEYLVDMKKLKWIGLVYTRVTADGVEKLRARLPNTIIEGSWKRKKESER